jgi:hypothetical protein
LGKGLIELIVNVAGWKALGPVAPELTKSVAPLQTQFFKSTAGAASAAGWTRGVSSYNVRELHWEITGAGSGAGAGLAKANAARALMTAIEKRMIVKIVVERLEYWLEEIEVEVEELIDEKRWNRLGLLYIKMRRSLANLL